MRRGAVDPYPGDVRVPRTFVFVDLSGFTNFTADFGDDAAGRVLSSFRALTRQVASERAVRIAKWLGDGCMLVAVEPADGIAAVMELQARSAEACAPLALRAGVATGYALLFEGDDYIGSAVNLAARLCDVAGPYEVLLPADQADELPAGVNAEDVGPVQLHGLKQRLHVVRLTGAPQPATPGDEGEVWTRSPFVA